MNATKDATTINLADIMTFSSDVRVNQEVLSTDRLMVRMNCYESGQVTPMHMHPEEDEVMYIVEGEGVVTFKDRDDLPVKAGELVCLPSDQYHQITAGPEGRMVLIYFMTPEYGSIRPEGSTDESAVTRLPGEDNISAK
jgi:quercetin dioxygenase-like cupin family protein